MKKADFIRKVAKNGNMTLTQAAEAVKITFDTLREILIDKEDFSIDRFMSFKSVVRPARMGFSPLTREKIQIPPIPTVKIKFSAKFKEALNPKKKK